MASGASLDFVPARRPEAVRMDVSKFKIIDPKIPSISGNKKSAEERVDEESDDSDESFDDESSSEEESNDSDESSGSSSDSMEDSEKSDTDATSYSTSSSEDEDDEADGEADKQKSPLPKTNGSAEPKSGNFNSLKRFYDINENVNDRGTREPRRIHKSWHAAARAPVGLQNRGVTCYMNSAIQAILHLPAIGRYLLEVLSGSHPKVSKDSVTYELAALFKKMMEKKSAVYPMRMLRRLDDINPMLDEWQQEDSHEYYMSLLSRLQEDSVPKGEKLRSSVIHDIFGGSVEQRVTCQLCKTVSTTNQDFYDLPVSFSPHESGKNYTLDQSIRDFFTPDKISVTGKGTGYQCENCKQRTNAIKHIAISEAPEYLTVHIKRFKMDEGVSKKLKETMNYSLDLSMTQYTTNPDVPLHYKLIAVIVHEGRTVSSGHYIALARQPNNTWMMYDDELTRPVPESYVASHPSAYILLYSRLLAKPGTKAEAEPKAESKAEAEPARGDTSKAETGKATKSAKKGASKKTEPVKAKGESLKVKTETTKPSKDELKKSKKLAKQLPASPKSNGKIKQLPSPRKDETLRKVKLLQKLNRAQKNKSKKAEAEEPKRLRLTADTIDEIFGKTKKRKPN